MCNKCKTISHLALEFKGIREIFEDHLGPNPIMDDENILKQKIRYKLLLKELVTWNSHLSIKYQNDDIATAWILAIMKDIEKMHFLNAQVSLKIKNNLKIV